MVSHSGFLRAGVTGRWFFNADYRVFDFDGVDEETGTFKLNQWELTDPAGGMGWSFETTVLLGEGLPDEEKEGVLN